MAYVDLNPIRAKMAECPEDSDYTSIQERITKKKTKLKSFSNVDAGIAFAMDDYLCLVDATGRAIIAENKGYVTRIIPDNSSSSMRTDVKIRSRRIFPLDLPDILHRLGLNSDIWLDEIKYFDKWYYKAIGTVDKLKKYCQSIGQKYIKGLPKHHLLKNNSSVI
ncbi:MAG TPA: hypothetical protein ENJ41_04775 [Oceanospirillales bacterium]|nr:hypothetical protein [Oceanospirillales bacterium]